MTVLMPAPMQSIDRGIVGPALLAHIAVSKFAYHIPLHRQAVMYARDGVEIDPGATGDWMGSIAGLLAPLVDAARRYALTGNKVRANDTPLPVLAPGDGRTMTGRLWAKSDMTKAIQWALNRWPVLIFYCSDGRAEIDNLIAERARRGVALGRRNSLFVGADSGGERAAAMYSLIGAARMNGLDPEAYLAYVLERIADHPDHCLDELLPWNVAPSLPSIARVEPIR